MGIYDRDYYQDDQDAPYGGGGAGQFGDFYVGRRGRMGGGGPGGFRALTAWSFTTWIIAINVAVFLLDLMISGGGRGRMPLAEFGYFSTQKALFEGQVWRFITFQFLHGGVLHILFNMLALFWFGPMVEGYLGSRRYLAFYLLCGVGGAAAYLVLNLLGNYFGNIPFLLPGSPAVPLVGASAGVYGVLLAGAFIMPHRVITLLLMFVLPVQMKMRTLAYGLVALAVLVVFMNGNNAGGQAGHLGGALVGAILIRKAHWLNWASGLRGLNRSSARVGSGGSAGFFEQRRSKRAANMDEEVNRILAKVGTQGIHSLTDKEKKTLARATEEQRKRNAG